MAQGELNFHGQTFKKEFHFSATENLWCDCLKLRGYVFIFTK